MKTVRLTINIGKSDAKRLGLAETLDGSIVSVDDKTADELLARRWAVEPGRDAAKIQAVPDLAIKSDAQRPDGGLKPDFARPDSPVPPQPAKVEPAPAPKGDRK